ncbi:MAG: class I SAM-dependent methyltransferase [Pseudomonadota bacterium]
MEHTSVYYQQPRDEMLPYIPRSVTCTLEVGCGEGIFSDRLKRDFGVEAWGIEYQEEAASIAAKKLDRVLAGSFDDSFTQLPRNNFDCVIFNDVLEHLVDPYSALQRTKELLRKNGVIVASIPNIRHWPEFVDYTWRGNWNYRNDGVLDRTHLRFFTKNSLAITVRNCGYEVITLEGINPYRSLWQRVATIISLGRLSDTLYKQYAIVIRPIDRSSTVSY